MTAEVTEIPEGIVRYLTRDSNRNYARSSNHYWVTDICRCLRQSFYILSGTPPDTRSKADDLVNELWPMQSGKLLHGLTYAYAWRELDIEKEFFFPEIDQTVHLYGRLDMYDFKTETIIDLKTTNAVTWQVSKGLIPRNNDIQQLQCYGSLFSEKMRVSALMLLYADIKNMVSFKVPFVDMSDWIARRLLQLYVFICITKKPPNPEPSSACDYCKFRNRCELDAV